MNSGYMLHIEHEEYEKRVDEEFKRINHRLKALEDQGKNQTELLISIKELTIETRDLKKEVIDQGERLETLESRDGESWRNFKWYTLTTVVGVLIGYVLNSIL